ncbi:MAG: hypothetical protein OEZ13_10275 [Spirochaetia bacterium]|nr:hypothetical protein [Spirochaetia bacterium]
MLHPMVIHLPLGLMFLVPIILILIWRKNQENSEINLFDSDLWKILIIVLALMTVGSMFSMMTGEHDEDIVEKIIQEDIIETHEGLAKVFTISVVFLFAGSIVVAFLKGALRQKLTLFILALSVLVIIIGGFTGKKGGELVYQHKAADAFGAKAGDLDRRQIKIKDDDD